MAGACGNTNVWQVPVGTLIKDSENNVLYDLNKVGDIYLAAKGGAGGHGNEFYLSNDVRAPTTYEEGGRGEERLLRLELSVIAHVGLVSRQIAVCSTFVLCDSCAGSKAFTNCYSQQCQARIPVVCCCALCCCVM